MTTEKETSPAVRNAMRRFKMALELKSLQHRNKQLETALRELADISGEATITLDSVKAVRKMGRFVAARERALEVLAEAERKTA